MHIARSAMIAAERLGLGALYGVVGPWVSESQDGVWWPCAPHSWLCRSAYPLGLSNAKSAPKGSKKKQRRSRESKVQVSRDTNVYTYSKCRMYSAER